MASMSLTDTAIRNAKPKEKPYKLTDGQGMYLLVNPNGSKYWRFKYLFNKKEKLAALGIYPEISLGEARERRLEARKLVANSIDPSTKKREERLNIILNMEGTFEKVSRLWHEANQKKWQPQYAISIIQRLEHNLFPDIGRRPIKEIKPSEILNSLRKVENKGFTELSHRLLQMCIAVFRYAIASGKAEYNPAADLKGALKAHKSKHHPTIEAKDLPTFIYNLEKVKTTKLNIIAIKFLLLTFVRQGELRRAEWQHINFGTKEWRIPAEHTKMKERHIVPLSNQSIELLKELQKITEESQFLFPSQQRLVEPYMSENTINKVLKNMGYKGKLVGHGFRALASTTLNEHGFKPDIIERQLAHSERNKVRAAYNRAEYLEERRLMLQWWADYLDQKSGLNQAVYARFGTQE